VGKAIDDITVQYVPCVAVAPQGHVFLRSNEKHVPLRGYRYAGRQRRIAHFQTVRRARCIQRLARP
jgi:hypothetical protein